MVEELTYTDDNGTVYKSAGHCGFVPVWEPLAAATDTDYITLEKFYAAYEAVKEIEVGKKYKFLLLDQQVEEGVVLQAPQHFTDRWPEVPVAIMRDGAVAIEVLCVFQIIDEA